MYLEATAFFSPFLPETTSLHLDAWQLDAPASLMTLHVTSTQTAVPCPICAVPAERMHSRYTRTLADLPWAHYRVRLQLQVRQGVLSEPSMRSSDLHRTSAHGCRSLGPADAAARPMVDAHRRGPRRDGWRTAQP